MTPCKRTSEILYQSEATLRLVDREIQQLGHDHAYEDASVYGSDGRDASVALQDLPQILVRANGQIMGVLSHLRHARLSLESAVLAPGSMTHAATTETASATAQLTQASATLSEVESQLVGVAHLLDGSIVLEAT